MAHYAFLDENNIVTHVIVGKDEGEDGIDWEQFYGAIRTSYNTLGGIYYDPVTREPAQDQSKAFRKNYAGIGYTWDGVGFAAPQPFPSWTLNQDSYLWESPTPYPDDGKRYSWDEATTSWVELVDAI